jgi:hypothetical protein
MQRFCGHSVQSVDALMLYLFLSSFCSWGSRIYIYIFNHNVWCLPYISCRKMPYLYASYPQSPLIIEQSLTKYSQQITFTLKNQCNVDPTIAYKI